jgi:hypothetical protein
MDLQELPAYTLDNGMERRQSNVPDVRYLQTYIPTPPPPAPEPPKLAPETATSEERIAALEAVVAHLTDKLQTCQKELDTVRTGYKNFGLDGNFRAFVQQVKKAMAQISRHH